MLPGLKSSSPTGGGRFGVLAIPGIERTCPTLGAGKNESDREATGPVWDKGPRHRQMPRPTLLPRANASVGRIDA